MITGDNKLQILEKARLKKTSIRISILEQFIDSNKAQSFTDLDKALKKTVDKSTLYRTLHSFEKAGIIHRINNTEGIAKYAFNHKDFEANHAHFECEKCKTTYCINTNSTDAFDLPEGFNLSSAQTTLKGICNQC